MSPEHQRHVHITSIADRHHVIGETCTREKVGLYNMYHRMIELFEEKKTFPIYNTAHLFPSHLVKLFSDINERKRRQGLFSMDSPIKQHTLDKQTQ